MLVLSQSMFAGLGARRVRRVVAALVHKAMYPISNCVSQRHIRISFLFELLEADRSVL